MKKIIPIFLALLCALVISGCSNSQAENAQTSENQTQTETQSENAVTENQASSETLVTRDEAIESAQTALKKTDFSKFGISAKSDDFEFQSCNLGNGDWRAEQNGYKNKVWTVEYKYKDSLADFVYFDIDAESGEVLYSGYMGD